jgi:hypothetical protein
MKTPEEWIDSEQWHETGDKEILELINAVQRDAQSDLLLVLNSVNEVFARRPALSDCNTLEERARKACTEAGKVENLQYEVAEWTKKTSQALTERDIFRAQLELLKKERPK